MGSCRPVYGDVRTESVEPDLRSSSPPFGDPSERMETQLLSKIAEGNYAMKNRKKLIRRGSALLIALVMCMSLLPAAALAVGSVDDSAGLTEPMPENDQVAASQKACICGAGEGAPHEEDCLLYAAPEIPEEETAETPEETPAKCTCAVRCAGDAGTLCPVCREDPAECEGAELPAEGDTCLEEDPAVQLETSAEGEPSERETPFADEAVPVRLFSELDEVPGSSAENPIPVPAEGLAIGQNGVLYGIRIEWFAQQTFNEDQILYVSISVPASVTEIANDGLRYTSTGTLKKNNGAVVQNEYGTFQVVGLDFEGAAALRKIGDQAVKDCKSLEGILDLSHTKVEQIGKFAFGGCSGLTGVVLPETLKALGDPAASSGSAFLDCTGLEFIRTAGGAEDAVFELPAGLNYIGNYTFQNCFAGGVDAKVVIPASVERIGSGAFNSGQISQIVVKKKGDGWYSKYGGYDPKAFYTPNPQLLVIFCDATSYHDYSLNRQPNANVKKAMAYPLTIRFGYETQTKLNYQSVQYEKILGTDFWAKNEQYELPPASPASADKPGYDYSWMLGNNKLTNTSKIDTNISNPSATLAYSLQEPTVQYAVDGQVQESSRLTVTWREGETHTAGVQVDHPLLLTRQGEKETEYVYFKYCWWDEVQIPGGGNTVNGPRSEKEPDIFSTSESTTNYNRKETDLAEIPISSEDHQRTGGDQYLVEIIGYIVKNGGEPELFYKSHYNFIDFGGDYDIDSTTNAVYTIQVTVNRPINCTVTFKLNGAGGQDPSVTVEAGQKMGSQMPADPIRSGYTFTGWNTQANGTGSTFTAATPVTGDMVVYAQWKERYSPPDDDDDDDDDRGDRDITIPKEKVPLAGDLQLNREDHFAYVRGYADGTVRPNTPITRAQAATIFYRLLTDISREIYFRETNAFTDVPDSHWANQAISTLSNAGVILGFQDGTFRPDAYITRAQFAAMTSRFETVHPGLENPFADVSEDHWARDIIAYAADQGWVTSGRNFRPQENITRVEVMDLLNNVLDRRIDEKGLLPNVPEWSDVKAGDPCYYVVMEATVSHDYERRNKRQIIENWTKLTKDPVWE